MSDAQRRALHYVGLVAGGAIGLVIGLALGVSRLEMMVLVILGLAVGKFSTWALMKASENQGAPRGKRRLEGWQQEMPRREGAEAPKGDDK